MIISRISKFPDKTIDDQMHQSNPRFGGGCNRDQVRSKAAIAKLEDGNIRAAVKILSSNDEPAADNRGHPYITPSRVGGGGYLIDDDWWQGGGG